MTTRAMRTRQRARKPATHTGEHGGNTMWEWRAFDPKISLLEIPGLEAMAWHAPTIETWLLSPSSSFGVRIHDQEIEIRRIEHIDRRSLEQWRVIHRYQFPVDAAAIAAVCVNLGVPEPALAAPADREQFLAGMAFAAPDVIVVPVRTERAQFRMAGCDGEQLKLVIGDQRWEGLAFFSRDSACVHAALQEVGLSTFQNMNWPRALKLILGVTNRPARRE
jgi:hypothetical protein